MGIVVKLRDVRMVYPHLGKPDKWGKFSVGALVPKGSDAYKALMEGLGKAWEEARDKFGKVQFESNPTESRLLRAAYIRVGGGEDAKGRPLPEWMNGYVSFGVQSQTACPVVDENLEPITAADPSRCYSGQRCHISLDLVPFNNAESKNAGISRYLRSVVVLGGGEAIATSAGGFTDIVEEWS